MGIIRQGILGGFRNKTGSVIGAYWRSLDVIKGLPRKSNKPPTEEQLNQRARFGLITGFLSWIGPLIEVGYKALSGVESSMNLAVSYHLNNAVTGVAPNFTIDYPKVKYSRGKLKLLPKNGKGELPKNPGAPFLVGFFISKIHSLATWKSTSINLY